MNDNPIPNSVRYVKNGAGGKWWPDAKSNGQIHFEQGAGVTADLIEHPDFEKITKLCLEDETVNPRSRRLYLNQLLMLLNQPSQHVWITFEAGYMWWCTVQDGVKSRPTRDGLHCWLTCDRDRLWSKVSLNGKPLARGDLPGKVARVAGYQSAIAKPTYEVEILRIIKGEVNPLVEGARNSRANYEDAVGKMIAELNWQDFEQLIDLVLARTGWTRISKRGGPEEGFDIEAQNLAANEIAFVQVKSEAPQATLDDYVRRFGERRDRYARMIFAVHNPKDRLIPPSGLPVQVWDTERLAELVARLGLGEWVEQRLA